MERLHRTQIIGVVVPLGHDSAQSLSDPFLSALVGHVADEIAQRGYGMLLQKVMLPMPGWLAKLVASRQSDGLVILGQSTEHKVLQAVAADFKPMVVWGAPMPRQKYCTIGADDVAAGLAATNHLLTLGRRTILFFGDPAIPEIGLRYAGYRRALAHRSKGVAGPRAVPTHMTAASAYETMCKLLAESRRFDAVVAASDVIALNAIRAMTAAGLSVPKDVAVVGFDDISLARYVYPPLTAVRQDTARAARALIAALFRRMAGEEAGSETMPTELVIRESCGHLLPRKPR
jgi:DNA-binding LacI/PurR family transcriptional regulator